MKIEDAFSAFNSFDLWLIIIGLAILATAILPRILSKYPFSMPIILVLVGFLCVYLPGIKVPDFIDENKLVERVTEFSVIIALMGAGLKIDRKIGFKSWSSTWRLLGITMVLSIAASAFLGWYVAALTPAAAVLLGAVIAPTDPVLAADVQVGPPGKGSETEGDSESLEQVGNEKVPHEDEVRFALTSEAGLNDGLAFPFTNLAIAIALVGTNPAKWLETWLLIDVVYKLVIGVILGIVLGQAMAYIILRVPAKSTLAKAMMGLGALAATFIIYGATQYLGGYGFLATFIGGIMIRRHERKHELHHELHILTEKAERVFVAVIMLAFGAAIAGNLFSFLNWSYVLCAVLIVLLVRPAAGMIGLIGFKKSPWREKLAISFFGIRGVGSIYYLTYAFDKAYFTQKMELWAIVGLVIVISVFLHGILSTPVTQYLDKLRPVQNATNT